MRAARVVLPLLFGGLLLSWVVDAQGGRRSKKKRGEQEQAEVVPAPAPQVEASWGPLFATQPPVDVGELPPGLANLSAQGCAACHPDSHASWAGSPHAGRPSEAFDRAVDHAGTPACRSCHEPLLQQWPQLLAHDGGDPQSPVMGPNPAWNPTLQSEGVTCAACHVRQGTVLSSTPTGPAPHPTAQTDNLRDSTLCATCHQLTWPGAETPLYDTWGEYDRSGYADQGIGCVDCHMGSGAEARPAHHRVGGLAGRGISVLAHLDSPRLVRGAEPTALRITVQNTGAGHAVPTGSPYQGLQLRVELVGPVGPDGAPSAHSSQVVARFERVLSEAPPWSTTTDTRMQAGESRTVEHGLQLPHDAPSGRWAMHIHTERTVRGQVVGEPVQTQIVPLVVD